MSRALLACADGDPSPSRVNRRPLVPSSVRRTLSVDSGSSTGSEPAADDSLALQRAAIIAAALDHMSDAVAVTTPDGRVLYVNESVRRLLGYGADELDATQRNAVDPTLGDRSCIVPARSSLRVGQPWSGVLPVLRRDGTLVEIDVLATPIRDVDGEWTGTLLRAIDRSRERSLEAELRQTQKVAALGQIAGGLAHDINNVLTAVRGFADIHLASHVAEPDARDDLVQIMSAVDRATELTRRLLSFSRRSDPDRRPLHLPDVVLRAAPMLRRLLGTAVVVDVEIHSGVPLVTADETEVVEILLNLVTNARDAMPNGGTLTIRADSVTLDTAFVDAHPGSREGSHALLEVVDTGSGMDERTKARLFEPFFTTKAPGQGTGLGLSTIRAIVAEAAGYVDVETRLGEGSIFRVYLPATRRPSSEAV